MFGYAREQLVGRPAEVLVPVRFRQRHADLRKKFSIASQTRLMGMGRDLSGVRKDGSEFAVEIGISPAATNMGYIFIATIADITERKRIAEKENVRECARENVQLCQQLGVAAAVLQRDGQVLLANQLFKELHSLFKFRADRVQIVNPMANKLFKQALASLDRCNGEKNVVPIPVLAADGCPPFIFYLLPMDGSFGSTLGILVVTTLSRTRVPSPNLVQSLFALAPAEARVAALIGSGLSPRQAAEKLGVSEGNVRTTLKHVFTRIGVSRQTELALLLAKLALVGQVSVSSA